MIKKLFNWLEEFKQGSLLFEDKTNLGVLNSMWSYIALCILFIIATSMLPVIIILYSFKFIYQLCEKFKFPRNIIKELEKYEKKLLALEVKYHLANSYNFSDKYVHDENLNLKKFISVFLFSLNDRYATYRHRAFICGPSRRRSAGDIFLICKNYYPNCTFIQVLKILISMLEDKYCDLTGDRCGTIRKYVFYIYGGRNYRDDQNVEYSDNLNFKDIIKALK